MSDDNYKPQHAAPTDWERSHAANLRAKRYHGTHRANPPEVTVTRFDRYTTSLADYPADVRMPR